MEKILKDTYFQVAMISFECIIKSNHPVQGKDIV